MLNFYKLCIDVMRWSQLRARGFENAQRKEKNFSQGNHIAPEEADYVSEDRRDSGWGYLLFVLGKQDDFITAE